MKLGEEERDWKREREEGRQLWREAVWFLCFSRMKESGKRASLVTYAEASLVGSLIECRHTNECELWTYTEGHPHSWWVEKARSNKLRMRKFWEKGGCSRNQILNEVPSWCGEHCHGLSLIFERWRGVWIKSQQNLGSLTESDRLGDQSLDYMASISSVQMS